MKRRKRVRQDEKLTLGERWVTGRAFGELFQVFKRLRADDLTAVLAKFEARERLTPTATSAVPPAAETPKRIALVPEVVAIARAPDGEGFARILAEAWEHLQRQHPRSWTAGQVIHSAIALQRENPGAFLRLLEAVRRFWDELPGSPFHALERERVKRFLDFVAVELELT